MRLAYYRDKEGKITNFHKADRIPDDEVEQRVADYNNNERGDTVYIIDYDDGSFEAFLYRKAVEHIKFQKETLDDLRDTLSSAESYVWNLISQAEAEARK